MTDDAQHQIAIYATPGPQGETFYTTDANWDTLQHAYEKNTDAQIAQLRQTTTEKDVATPYKPACTNLHTLVACDLPTDLTHVTTPAHITRISKKAFAYKSNMQQIQLGPNVTILGLLSFSNCGLTHFSAPDALVRIGEKAFSRCLNLVEVQLNNHLEYIGSNAFANTPLAHIEIPASVRKIALGAFPASCKISISKDNPHLKIDDAGCLYRRINSGWILEEATQPDLTNYVVAPGTIAIAERAFTRAKAIEQVTLPEGLLSIGAAAFKNCKHLQRVHMPETLLSIGASAFYETALSHIYIPAQMEHLGALALVTTGSNTADAIHTLQHIEVDAQNRRFYTLDNLLIERNANYYKRSIAVPGRPNHNSKMDISKRTDINAKNQVVRITTRGGIIGRVADVDIEHMHFVNFDESKHGEGNTQTNLPKGESPMVAAPPSATFDKTEASAINASTTSTNADFSHARPRRKYGHHRVIAFFGNAKHVTIPHACDAISAYAFAGVSCIDELRIHVGLTKIDLCAFSVRRAMSRICIDTDTTPSELCFNFPQNEQGKRAIFQSFRPGQVDIAVFAAASDNAIYWCNDMHARAKHALERLHTPRNLTVSNASRFEKLLRDGLPRICDVFAQHDDTEGFDLLFELGYINESNVTDIIEHLASGKNVAITGYLLELKRRHFGQTLLNFDL